MVTTLGLNVTRGRPHVGTDKNNPDVHIQTSEVKDFAKEPTVQYVTVEKIVEVPRVQIVEKIVEVPCIQYIEKEIEKLIEVEKMVQVETTIEVPSFSEKETCETGCTAVAQDIFRATERTRPDASFRTERQALIDAHLARHPGGTLPSELRCSFDEYLTKKKRCLSQDAIVELRCHFCGKEV